MLYLAAGTKAIAGADTYLAQRSLRFRNSAPAYLSKTVATPTNNNVWTWSAWVKRSGLGVQQRLFAASTTNIQFNAADTITVNIAGSATATSTAVFRDTSAWYHIVVTRSGTAGSGPITVYVNNVSVATGTATVSGGINTASTIHYIGISNATNNPFDGYMAEVYFVDGQALTPSSFGATNTDTGVWRAKAYTGTYGTNGFYLNFADNSALTTTSNVGLGKDNSGNGNYYATSGISITAGTTYDSMTDVPTNTSATVANYAVINPLFVPTPTGANVLPYTVTDGNLTLTNSTNNNRGHAASIVITPSSGKWYWEITMGSSIPAGVVFVGMAPEGTLTGRDGTNTYWYLNSGVKYINGTSSAYGASFTNNDVIGVAYDSGTGVLTMYKNNTSQGTLATLSTSLNWSPSVAGNNTASTYTVYANFGQRPFTYTPPTGYVALNTYNLPDSTILKANKYMDATTYTGTGASLSVTNASAFKPDFVWIKGRSGTTDHALYDFVRGTTKDLLSNSTAAETTQATGLTAFNTNGFTVGALAKLNTSAATYVGWQWVGSGASVSNTSGSITSTVDANTTAGFSIVTYTGTGANATVGHGLGVAPKMLLIKPRSAAAGWFVWHTSILNTQYLVLETSAAVATAATGMNSTSPTSTVFSLGSGGANGSGTTLVAYCFAEIAGFSKFGSYTGNASTDGTFIYTGFRPKFVMVKRTDAAGNSWDIIDAGRNPTNVGSLRLRPDQSAPEDAASTWMDLLSNGFKIRIGVDTDFNASGGTYIYMAFAENPLKYSNAR